MQIYAFGYSASVQTKTNPRFDKSQGEGVVAAWNRYGKGRTLKPD